MIIHLIIFILIILYRMLKCIYKCLRNIIKKYVYDYHTTKEYDEYLGNLYCDLHRIEIRRRLYDDGGFDV
ncbi:hypothetical protein ACE4V3_04530 (plasmid) [Borrelia recurrentis]|uniref:hypothetical protein n=1 Tax=Borrelia recurrentis TaxID=44449 RepID=UPI0012EAFD03|nr:hypothetical protein [Borrelia recurrentis]